MITKNSLLVTLILLVEEMPIPEEPPRRGGPKLYSDRLMLKALIIMILRRFTRVHELWTFLNQPQAESIRALLSENGRFPSRRTFEWIPLAAELTPANVADNKKAPSLVDQLPKEVCTAPRFLDTFLGYLCNNSSYFSSNSEGVTGLSLILLHRK